MIRMIDHKNDMNDKKNNNKKKKTVRRRIIRLRTVARKAAALSPGLAQRLRAGQRLAHRASQLQQGLDRSPWAWALFLLVLLFLLFL